MAAETVRRRKLASGSALDLLAREAVPKQGVSASWSMSVASGFGFFRKAAPPPTDASPAEMLDAYLERRPDLIQSLGASLSHTANVASVDSATLQERLDSTDRNAVLAWDFDGTIADTEKLHVVAYNVLLHPHGVELTPPDFDRYKGKTEFEIYGEIERDFGVVLLGDVARAKRLEVFHALMEKTKLGAFSYVVPTLDAALAAGAASVVVSSQMAHVVSRYLRDWSIASRFAALLTPDLFGPKKLELFTSLPTRFGRAPSSFIVLEDSLHVLEAVRSLGMSGYHVQS